jgi:signal transduction histidine kinase
MDLYKGWIKKQGEFAKTILNTLILDIKSKRPDWQIEKKRIHIKTVILGAVNSLQAEMDKDNIKVRTTIEKPDSLWIMADEFKLHIVIVNLLRNAFAAIPLNESEEKRTILIRCKKQNGNIVISVQDKGKGMTKEELNDIYRPFYGTRTGLGLDLVKKIIMKHSGSIHIESKSGSGTRVAITLPSGVET